MDQNLNNNSYCRLCLNVDKDLECVFDNNRGNNICNYIQHFFAVEISKNDTYSTSVCQACLDFIILICKKRLLFRENNVHIKSYKFKNNFEITDVNQIEIKNDQCSSCHPSVIALMNKHKNIIIPEEYLGMNFDCSLRLTRVTAQQTVHDVLANKPSYRLTKKRSKCHPVTPKYLRDPSYIAHKRIFEKYTYDSSTDNEDDSLPEKRIKRSNKQPPVFGNPIFYDQFDIDVLNEIWLEDEKREEVQPSPEDINSV